MIANKINFDWHNIYDHKQISDVFYCIGNGHNQVVYMEFNGRRVKISCDGEMSFYYGNTRIRSNFDLEEAGIDSDAVWSQIRDSVDDGLFPWFDAYEWNEEKEYWEHLDMVSGELDEIINRVQVYLAYNEER